MNQEQLNGLFRDVGKMIAMFFVTKGGLDGAYIELFGGMIAMVLLSAWSFVSNELTAMISRVASSDKVTMIDTTQQIARDDPNPKVVSTQGNS